MYHYTLLYEIFYLLVFLDDGLIIIIATPAEITTVAIIVCELIDSPSITHPKNTAITGTIYAKVFANDGVVEPRSQ